MDKIKIGVIGCGRIFRRNHLPYYQEPTCRAQIVAVADLNEAAAGEQWDRFHADAYIDYRHLLDRQDIDAVDVACHPAPHRDIALAAAAAGKHMLIEKPMCRNVAEADEMVAAAEEERVLLQVAYTMRFNPGYMKLKQLLVDGRLGALQMAYTNQLGYLRASVAPWWLPIREESGGMLVEQAIHNLDIWLWLYGPASTVYGYTSHVPVENTYPEPEKAVENNAALIIHFQNGGIGTMTKSWVAEVGNSGDGMVGSKGSAVMLRQGLRWKTHDMAEAEEFIAPVPDDDGTYRTLPPDQRQKRYWDAATKGASIDHWLACVAGEEKPTTDGRIGRAGIELTEAVYRSASLGAPVSLPL